MNKKSAKIEYLVIGHVTHDIVGDHKVAGGTVTYSSLCANNLGLYSSLFTICETDFTFPPELAAIKRIIKESPITTTFENIETKHGREQVLHQIARPISVDNLPDLGYQPAIVHLGPVADEINSNILDAFPESFIGLTPQGWMRKRDENNIVHYQAWKEAQKYLERANAVVLSIEDVRGDRELVEQYAAKTKVLVLTEGNHGAVVYWNGDMRKFSAPSVPAVDATGAGDIFAAAFFATLFFTNDPWEAGRKAVSIASASVSKVGIKGVPTPDEMRAFNIEIIERRDTNG